MKYRSDPTLREELQSSGAHSSELDALVGVATSLEQLKTFGSPSAQREHANSFSRWWITCISAGLTAIAGLTAGMALILLSQTVLPGSWLYPVQKLSDSATVAVSPQYRGTVMMKRAHEVQLLVASHAKSPTVLATLADYQAEASTYKSISTNYVAFEYCKASLQQAAATAPDPEHQAITAVLVSLKNV